MSQNINSKPFYDNTMIRKNVLFCKLIRIKNSSGKLFSACMNSFQPAQVTCPVCKSSGNCHIHAYYGRKIIDFINGKPVRSDLTVMRLICDSCGHTHAVLPDFIIPYSQYGLFFILRALAEAFLSWRTIEEICERFQITVNQFYQWKHLWFQHKREWLGLLADQEMSDLRFLQKICCRLTYSDFAQTFFQKTAFSFLQSHRNPSLRKSGSGLP